MGGQYTVALIGFSAFERSTLEAFFRLAARRTPSYSHSPDGARADLLLVDADSADAMNHPLAMSGRCLFIGAVGGPGQLAHMPRPINMMALLKQLDSCAAVVRAAAAPAAPASVTPRPAAATAALAPKVVAMPVTPPIDSVAPAHGPSAAARMDHILVVDDSDIALRFMANSLGRFGFDVHLARSGEEALSRVAATHYEFVFMDVTMPGIDGYQTCKLIKKRPYPAGRRAPSVVMLTSRGGMVDKMRGTLSGCDAYLTKPLQHDALLKVIGDRIVSDIAEADTQRDVASTV
jgi:two-component system, cell cycle response regulator